MAAQPAALDLSNLVFPLPPFFGDTRDADVAFQFSAELRRAGVIYEDFPNAAGKIIRIWAILLHGDAKAWWTNLPAAVDKSDITVVADAFDAHWPEPNVQAKTQAERLAEFEAVVISDEDVGRRHVDSLGRECAKHVFLLEDMRKKAIAATPDGKETTAAMLVPAALKAMPPRLVAALGDTWSRGIKTWADLIKEANALTPTRIAQVIEQEHARKTLEDRIAAMEITRTAATKTTVQATPAPTPSPFATPTNTFATRQLYTSRLRQPLGSFPPPGRTQTHAAPFDPAGEVAPHNTKDIKLTFADTPEGWREYDKSKSDWDDKWHLGHPKILPREVPFWGPNKVPQW
ncbi:unnamed protein product [Mycena citricolor]|uniref:Uncharacterized protein n=1 Tax=Mycena citricolor TaxID=2018698 RepID=A0AAD2H5W1_9AGAR|nr:unnamed protein product [Mycena citricolor]